MQGTASYTRGDELLSMEKGGKIWYYLYDGHGSTRFLTSEAGRITDRYAYDAYGNLLQKKAIQKTNSSTQGSSTMRIQDFTT